MVDSSTVLWGQAIAYTLYVLAILSLMGWFAYRVTRTGKAAPVPPALFYSYVGLLVVVGVSLHIVSYNTIPWSPLDLHRHTVEPDKSFTVSIADHQFTVPQIPLQIDCGDKVLFEVTSDDLTYGFGLFRPDHSMLFQMQVVPGHTNDVLWEFTKDGVYSIRSTEYSGPLGHEMVVEDAVQVTGCGPGS